MYIFWILAHKYICFYFPVISLRHFYFLLNIYIIDTRIFYLISFSMHGHLSI